MTVAQPTTPASYFHLLRWHTKNPSRRPLIVFEPKSMLRLKAAASKLSDITTGNFRPFIPDADVANASRLILCSGKIYWELVAERQRRGDTSTSIARVEQLYPLATDEIIAEMNRHPNATVIWAQDEPANQGPWPFISDALQERTTRKIERVSRRATASPSTGSAHVHDDEQKALIAEAFSR